MLMIFFLISSVLKIAVVFHQSWVYLMVVRTIMGVTMSVSSI